MDHLPLPCNPIHDPIEVPWLGTEEYDGGDLATYPDRQGWGLREVREWQIIFENPPQKFLAFLQTWLFFGPLKLILGDQFHQPAFIVEAESSNRGRYHIITTASLLPMLSRWIESGKQQEIRYSDNRTDIVVRLIGRPLDVQRLLAKEWKKSESPQLSLSLLLSKRTSLYDFIQHFRFEDPRDPRIAVSDALMIETLLAAIVCWPHRDSHEEYLSGLNGTNVHLRGRKNFLYSRLEKDGWCPSEISMMSKRLNGAALYFMSHVGRPKLAQKHVTTQAFPALSPTATSDNDHCTESRCSINQLCEDTYRTKHAEGCLACYEMIAEYHEIFEILKSGNIPLIVSIDQDNNSCKVELVKSKLNLDYVAISHVWSDGLGNVSQSALPRCVMLRLSRLIRSLPGGMSHFWIDTIGCPPDKAGENEAQDLAISMMRQTYEGARAVLVLDSWLEPKVVKDMPEEEILSRIICSAWNSRLWTLQEGALAKSLFFQFADKQYDLDDGIVRLNQLDDLALELLMKNPINERVVEFRRFRQMKNLGQRKINALRSALAFRSTSVASDEAICLSTLLDLDVRQIVRTPPGDRMWKFWSLVPQVPAGILFHKCPRLDIEGHRWAPRTLLRNANVNTMLPTVAGSETQIGQISPEGLIVRYSGFMFPTGRYSIGMNFHGLDECGDWYIFECDFTNGLGCTEYDVRDRTSGNIVKLQGFDPWELYGSEKLAFISSTDERMEGLGPLTGGIFASIIREEHDVLYVKVLCLGRYYRVQRVQPSRNRLDLGPRARGPLPRANALDRRLAFARARSIPKTQQWCVG